MSLPPPVGICKCGAPARLRLVEVRHRFTGLKQVCPCSEVARMDNAFHQSKWELIEILDPWEFLYWVELCAGCFYGDPPQPEGKKPPPADPITTAAWTWLINQAGRDAFDDSEPKADEYMERCNRQAKTSNVPDAIPECCWLDHVWHCSRDVAIGQQTQQEIAA